jgi:hypothetical protein
MDQDVAEELNLARYHASVARPAHATMFFPMSNPTENAADVIHQSLADPTGEHNGARITLGERLPSDVVGALINLPESGSLEDWRQAADRDGAARHLERMRTRSRARDAHVERRAQRLRAQLRETSTVSEESFY